MLPSIHNSFCQGRGQWQRLSDLARKRNGFHSPISRGRESTTRTLSTPRSKARSRESTGIIRSFSSAFPVSPVSPMSGFRLPAAAFRSNNNFAGNSKSKLARTLSPVTFRAPASFTRHFSSEPAKTAVSESKGENPNNSYFGVLFQRLAMSLGIVYIVTEYGIEWTVCEGPSMMPTVKPRGEIVLIDRLTPKLWGLAGGDTISKREASAKALQEEHVRNARRRKKDQRDWLLRLYQEEEERLEQKSRVKEKMRITGKQEMESAEKQSTSKPAATNISDSNPKISLLEQESQSQKNSNATNFNSQDNTSTKEILRELREDLEQRSNDDAYEETWHETRIPVDKLPPEGAWERFRTQITTGISVGDVVVLQHPDRIGTVCKRVMGLPGDIVTKPSSKLGANRIEDLLYGERGKHLAQTSSPLFAESEQERLRFHQRTKRRLLSSGVQVPDGHIWVEGDNPWNSSDSRNYGAVPASLIMGRVLMRLWPLRGSALMERGGRPVRSESDESSLAFSGSIVVPVGWEDQRIVREYVPAPTEASTAKVPESTPKQSPGKRQEPA